jgi:hypothetical protein
MRYIASFKCDSFLSYLTENNESAMGKNLSRRLVEIKSDNLYINVNKALFTIIELGIGYKFENLIKRLSEAEFKQIVFQLFYTLRQLYLTGIRHNDIHLGNVWINILPQPIRMIYFITDNQYAIIETKYIVKVYDFDMSAFFTENIRNTRLNQAGYDMCGNYGTCENDNERFDLLTVLYLIGTYPKLKHAKEFVDIAIRNPKYKGHGWYKFEGRYCESLGKKCSPTAEIDVDDVYNILQLCENTIYFDDYLRNLEDGIFMKSDIPIKHRAKESDIPFDVFDKNVYISLDCRKNPIQLANYLLETFG